MDTSQLTVMRLMDRAATLFPDKEVITHGVPDLGRISYERFVRRVHRLAHVLDTLGVGRGDRVATLAWNHQRHLELYFAVPAHGSVLHTINLRLSVNQISDIVTHAGDSVIFIDSDQVRAAQEALAGSQVRTVVVMGSPDTTLPEGWLQYEQLMGDAPGDEYTFASDLSEYEIAAICYSSATTGMPKGVEYSHRALYLHTTALCMAETWALSEADTILPVVPMFHVNAWGIPYAAVWLGATLVLPGPTPLMPELADLIVRHEVTFAAAVPTVWTGVFDALEHTGTPSTNLRMLVSGGAPLPPPLLDQADRLGVPLVHSYGMTEASPLVLVGRLTSKFRETSPEGTRERRLRQGMLVPGLEMAVMKDGRPVPWDGRTPGELWLRGPWIAERYRNAPELASAFDGGWYHSGDVVDVDPDGYVRVVDRISDLIKSGGEWISSIELENALVECPGITAAAVISVPDPKWSERPAAYAVADARVTDDDIRQHLLRRFPRWWLPDDIMRVEAIPLTSVGKFDKRALRSTWKEESHSGDL